MTKKIFIGMLVILSLFSLASSVQVSLDSPANNSFIITNPTNFDTTSYFLGSYNGEFFIDADYWGDNFENDEINDTFWYNYTAFGPTCSSQSQTITEANGNVTMHSNVNGDECNGVSVIRTRYDYNDGKEHLINFEMEGSAGGANAYWFIEFNNGTNFPSTAVGAIGGDNYGKTLLKSNAETGVVNYTIHILPHGEVSLINETNITATQNLSTQPEWYFSLRTGVYSPDFSTQTADISMLNFVSVNDSIDSALINSTLYIWNGGTTYLTNTKSISYVQNSTSFTNINVSDIGSYEWNAYVCSIISCQFSGLNNSFDYGYNIASETFISPSFETQDNKFILNLTLLDGASLSSAKFIYNGTSDNNVDLVTDGNNISLSITKTSPSVTTQNNITFYWNFTIEGTEFSSSEKTQIVNDLGIDNCTINSVQILNYTLRDEGDRSFINSSATNTTMEISLTLTGDVTGEVFTMYSNSSNTNPVTICVSNNLSADTNYYLDSEVKYSSDDRVTEYHNLLDTIVNISAIPLSYNLYDLASADSQEFLITVKDRNFVPVENAIIEITRQYLPIGQFLEVERPKTDGEGRTIGHFVLNDEVYSIFVKKDGSLIGSFTNVRTFCADANNDCRLNLNVGASTIRPEDFINNKNVSYTNTYNDTTRTFTFTFATTDNTAKTFNLTGEIFNNYGNNSVCSKQIIVSSGVLSCTFPETYQNATGIITINVNGELLSRSIFPITLVSSANLGGLGYLMAFLLVLTLPLLAYTSGVMLLMMFLIGVAMSGGIFILGLGGFIGSLSAFLWIVIAVGVLIWKATKEENA